MKIGISLETGKRRRDRLKQTIQVMIGLSIIVIIGDVLILLMRWIGMEKSVAIYSALLLTALIFWPTLTMIHRRAMRHPVDMEIE